MTLGQRANTSEVALKRYLTTRQRAIKSSRHTNRSRARRVKRSTVGHTEFEMGREKHGRHPCAVVLIDPRSSSIGCGEQKVTETLRPVKPAHEAATASLVRTGFSGIAPGEASERQRGLRSGRVARRQDCPVENPPRQGRKAAFARDRGLSALRSLALTDVDRLLALFTFFPFIPRFYLDFLAPELYSGTPSTTRCFADGRRRAKIKRHHYTEWRGNLPCQLRRHPGERADYWGRLYFLLP